MSVTTEITTNEVMQSIINTRSKSSKMYGKRTSTVPYNTTLTKIGKNPIINESSDYDSSTEMGNACKGDVHKTENKMDYSLLKIDGINFTIKGDRFKLPKDSIEFKSLVSGEHEFYMECCEDLKETCIEKFGSEYKYLDFHKFFDSISRYVKQCFSPQKAELWETTSLRKEINWVWEEVCGHEEKNYHMKWRECLFSFSILNLISLGHVAT